MSTHPTPPTPGRLERLILVRARLNVPQHLGVYMMAMAGVLLVPNVPRHQPPYLIVSPNIGVCLLVAGLLLAITSIVAETVLIPILRSRQHARLARRAVKRHRR